MTQSEISNLNCPNILSSLGINNPTEEQLKDFNHLLESLNITERNAKYLFHRFSQNMTLQEIANNYNVSRQAVDCGIKRSFEKMKKHPYWGYVEYGFDAFEEKKAKEEKVILKKEKDCHRKNVQRKLERAKNSDLRGVLVRDVRTKGYLVKDKVILKKAYTMNIFDYTNGYSNYLINALHLCNYTFFGRDENCETLTFAEILAQVKTSPYWYVKVRGMGYKKVKELYALLFSLQFLTKFEYDYLCSFTRPRNPSYKSKKIA